MDVRYKLKTSIEKKSLKNLWPISKSAGTNLKMSLKQSEMKNNAVQQRLLQLLNLENEPKHEFVTNMKHQSQSNVRKISVKNQNVATMSENIIENTTKDASVKQEESQNISIDSKPWQCKYLC